MPTTVVGLVLFVLLLVPGLAHVLLLERHGSTRRLSTFRETVSVAFVSVVSLAAALAVFAVFRGAVPKHSPDVGKLIATPHAYFVRHYAYLFSWASAVLFLAVLFALAGASPRTRRLTARIRRTRAMLWLLPPARGNFCSGWTQMFLVDKPAQTKTYVGCTLADGTYMAGYLRSWNRDSEDTADRELTLTEVKIRPKGETAFTPLQNVGAVAVSSRNLQWISATYVPVSATPETPASLVRWWSEYKRVLALAIGLTAFVAAAIVALRSGAGWTLPAFLLAGVCLWRLKG